METNNYVCYIRVSTQRQGRSGLGLESQQSICCEYVKSVHGHILAEFKDVESGTHRNREGLNKAISFCHEHSCTLVIAKLDRLARDVEFTFNVINSGIDIHFCDMPVVNTIILGVFASVAQYERELTSKRTRDALKAKKTRGFALGNEKGYDMSKAIKASATSRRKKAYDDTNNRAIWVTLVKSCKAQNNGRIPTSDFSDAAVTLNSMGVHTSTGMKFNASRARSAYHNLKKIYIKQQSDNNKIIL